MSKVFLALLLAMTTGDIKRLTNSGTVLKKEKQNSPMALNKAQQNSSMVLENKQQIHSQPIAITTAGTHKQTDARPPAQKLKKEREREMGTASRNTYLVSI